jgi:chromosome segregation ATPase
MICPKCGFDQEERLDCKECGIVFSKYNALFTSSESSNTSEDEVSLKSEIQDLQIQVRELSSRLIDVDFEKTERKKMRSELTDLNKQVNQNQTEIETRMKQIKERLESSSQESSSQITPEILKNLPKSEEIEQKASELTDNLNRTQDQLTNLWEKTGQNSYQITELQDQVTFLRDEILETKNQLESIKKNQVDEEPKTIFDDDVKAIRKNLDELGQFISGLGKKE